MSISKSKLILLTVGVCAILPIIGFSVSYAIGAKLVTPKGEKAVAAADPDEIPSDDGGVPARTESGNTDLGEEAGEAGESGDHAAIGSPAGNENMGSLNPSGGATMDVPVSETLVTDNSDGPVTTPGDVPSASNPGTDVLSTNYAKIGAQSQEVSAMALRFNADVSGGKASTATTEAARSLLGKITADKESLFKEGPKIDAAQKANHTQLMKLYELNEARAYAIFQACMLSQNGDDFSERLAQGSQAKKEFDSLYPKSAPTP